MFALLPYLWILFMIAAIVATFIASQKNRPKKAPKVKAATSAPSEGDPLGDVEQVPDFGDELSQSAKT